MNSDSIIRNIDREVSVRHHSKRTGEKYKNDWKHVCECFPEVDYPKNLSGNRIKDFLQFISDTISPGTAAGCFYALKYYYTNVENQPYKLDGIKIKRPHAKIPEIVEHEMIMKVIGECENPQDKAIISAFYGTGARLEELITIERDCIHREGEKSFVHIKHGKGEKPRIVPLRPEIIGIIDKHIESLPLYKRFSRFLFPGEKKDHYIARSTAQRAVKRNFTEKNVYPHMLRHSLATWLFEQGVPLKVISLILGHSSVKTTEIYTHVRPAFLLQHKNPFDTKAA